MGLKGRRRRKRRRGRGRRRGRQKGEEEEEKWKRKRERRKGKRRGGLGEGEGEEREGRGEERIKNMDNKITITTYLLITSLNVNGFNASIKRHGRLNGLEDKTLTHATYE